MARCEIGPSGPTFASPPESIKKISNALYDYLLANHHKVYGLPKKGVLNEDNIDTFSLEQHLRIPLPGLPAGTLTPSGIVQTAVGALAREDRLTWSFTPDTGAGKHPPDGFVIYSSLGTTGAASNGVLVSASQRSYSFIQPAAAVVSYAIAAFRLTFEGQVVGPHKTIPAWEGVSFNAAVGGFTFYNTDITGADGVRLVFTSPLNLAFDPNGHPMATLVWKRDELFWVPATPALGEWTFAKPHTISVGAAPLADDPFFFRTAVAVPNV